MGITFALYLFARDVNRRLAWVLLVYSALMGFSLVYLGEHYAIDTMVGMACAFLVYRLSHYWSALRVQSHATR
jgi:membrane-associated phospholipid phosphatase